MRPQGDFKAEVADVSRHGTPIVLYEGAVKTELGKAWVGTVQPGNGKDGCPQWLKDLVIATDEATALAAATMQGLADVEPNSCCLDSRNVTVWSATREADNSVTIRPLHTGVHALVVNFNLKKPTGNPPVKRVQMNEVWISPNPLPDLLDLTGRTEISMMSATGDEDSSSQFSRRINRFARAFAQVQCHNETP